MEIGKLTCEILNAVTFTCHNALFDAKPDTADKKIDKAIT